MPDLWSTFKSGFNDWRQQYSDIRNSPEVQAGDAWQRKQLMKSAAEYNPLEQADVPGASALAMVPTAANIKRFETLFEGLRNNIKQSGPKLSDSTIDALSYLYTRYPQRMKRMLGFGESTDLPTGVVARALSIGDVAVDQSYAKSKGATDLVDTLGHETQHLVDYTRNHPSVRPGSWWEELYPMWRDFSTVLSKIPTKTELGKIVYELWPPERRAAKAGKTAAKGFEKFLELIK